MKIIDILSKGSIVPNRSYGSKRQLLEELARVAATQTGLDERVVFEALLERERLGTTGVGKGVALPHTRLAGLDKIFCAFVKSDPVSFDAVDGKPVDLIFLLLAPEESGADRLKALAKLSRILRDEAAAEGLRQAKSTDDIFALIEKYDAED
jgi:PTS system nitrogen regulatory IIA component